ncbi:MAG TPA: hypothetical protein VHB73_01595 [Alphaproteobacteria bacterium]|nr:hypothetical protein [Alphaproteobacteria bacterium]
MRLKVSPPVYLALCGLVKDALEISSDAEPVLRLAALELASAAGLEDVPEQVMEKVDAIVEMRDAALARKQSAA